MRPLYEDKEVSDLLVKTARLLGKLQEEVGAKELTVQQARMFLEALGRSAAVGAPGKEPPTAHTVGDALDIAQATVSRNITWLAGTSREKPFGPPIFDTPENPLNRRENHILLTPRGRRLVRELARAAR